MVDVDDMWDDEEDLDMWAKWDMRAENDRLRAIINEQSDAHVAHVKGLNEKCETERKILVSEIEKLQAKCEAIYDELMEARHLLRAEQEQARKDAFYVADLLHQIEKLRAAIFEKETVMQIRAAAAAALKETGDE